MYAVVSCLEFTLTCVTGYETFFLLLQATGEQTPSEVTPTAD